MNPLPWIYVALIAFALGHAIGWHRGSNYEHHRTEGRLSPDPVPHQEVDRSPASEQFSQPSSASQL